MTLQRKWMFNFTGWVLFTVSAVFFVWAALRADDFVSLIASGLFLVACLVFLVPIWRLRPHRED